MSEHYSRDDAMDVPSEEDVLDIGDSWLELNFEHDMDDGRPIKFPKKWHDVLQRITRMGGSRLFSLGQALMRKPDIKGDEVIHLKNEAMLFGYLAKYRKCFIDWARAHGCMSKSECYHQMANEVTRYETVEMAPHHPPFENRLYNHPDLPEPDYESLDTLIDFFCNDTPSDKHLIKALFVTAFWGGPLGSRPVMLITSPDGVGVGKSSVGLTLSKFIGGHISTSTDKDFEKVRTRLLSPGGLCKRMVMLDNETQEVQNKDLASMITDDIISGHGMYVGEATRPNTLLWVMSLNEPDLDRDLASRSVPISVRRPADLDDDGISWKRKVDTFVDEHKWGIISAIIAILREGPREMKTATRFPSWETEVLGNCIGPEDELVECQRLIRSRIGLYNAQDERESDIADAIIDQIGLQATGDSKTLGGENAYKTAYVFITSEMMQHFYHKATNGPKPQVQTVTKTLQHLIKKGYFGDCLWKSKSKHRRKNGFVWRGEDATKRDTFDNVWTPEDVTSADDWRLV